MASALDAVVNVGPILWLEVRVESLLLLAELEYI